ncbi:hypothetical protein BDV23DRAFT_195085 [Aspergillus alliaceus]|uniref:FAD-binding PCMH-type domain-containing protein n=1 Tax=Petromyces alliaceus TaxID=209559 RepID=A0A5N7C3C2_PETAA|nr:hypothetical protein BDV23DRAFT_195085 [Aspergillus alliaceus]
MRVSVLFTLAATVTADLHPFGFERHQLQLQDLQNLDPADAAFFSFADSAVAMNRTSNCKVFPADSAWPRLRTWDLLDQLIHWRCSHQTNSYFHNNDPIEMLSPVYQGLTCQPTANPNATCSLGGYPAYAVNVSSVAHIQLAINFARQTGVRLVVKDTGHDSSGKSGGAGALSIRTHNLKGIQYTVGVAGGYVLGGGHSPLSSIHDMAVDQVLSTEVVFPNERFVTASFTENTELFWALRGGGGSIFGVVTSVTIKAYPTIPATTSTFTWTTGPKSNITHGRFWAGIRAYLDLFIEHSDAGIYSYFFILPSRGEYTFLMQPFFAPNKTIPEIQALLNPWFQRLHQLGITFTPKTQYLDNFYSAWDASFPLEVVEKAHVVTGSRLFPKSNWEDPSRLNATFDAIRASSEAGLTHIAFNMAPTLSRAENPDNAVNPAWRRTVMHALSSVNWSPDATAQEITAARHNFTYGHMQRWRVVTEHGLPTENVRLC